MTKIAESDLLADIMTQISGYKITVQKTSTKLGKLIQQSEYAIS